MRLSGDGRELAEQEWSLIELNERRFVLGGKYKLHQNGNLFDLSDPMDEKLIPPEQQNAEAVAARVGATRLIDNMPLQVE